MTDVFTEVKDAEARRISRAGDVDQLRLAASKGSAKDVIDIWVSLLSSGIDLKADPDDSIADALVTHLFDKDISPLLTDVLKDYFTCGWSGLVITPWGVRALRPDEAEDLPRGYMRSYFLDGSEYQARTGKEAGSESIGITEAYSDGVFYLFRDGEIVYQRDWNYTPHILRGQERPKLNSVNPLLPLSLYESFKDVSDKLDRQGEAVDMIIRRASLIAVDPGSLIGGSSVEALSQRYNIIEIDKPTNLSVLDNRDLNELLAGLKYYEQLLSSRSGINQFQRGMMPRVDFASEVMEMQSSSGVRSSKIAEEFRSWLDDVIQDYRSYLVRLKPEDCEGVELHLEGKAYSWGPAVPYSVTLDGISVTLSTAGQAELLNRRGQYQQLLQILTQVPGYNPQPLVDKLILSFGLDPKELQSSELKPGQGELNGQSS